MKEFGVVTRADRDKIEVKVDRRSACGDCRACGMTEQEREHVFELANTVGAGAVSYTHLDVYKRQVRDFPRSRCGRERPLQPF